MKRSKVEKYVYAVCQKTDSGFTPIDTISFDHAVKTKKKKKFCPNIRKVPYSF